MSDLYQLAGDPAPGLRAAETAIDAGELVVIPTDTVYGLAARPDRPTVTARIFDVKGRSRTLSLPVLVGTERDAEDVAELDERARALIPRFWPGSLTIVVRRGARSRGWDLGEARDTIALRMPGHDAVRALLDRSGPLAVTSANRSGREAPATCAEARDAIDDAAAVYLCDDGNLGGIESTVIDLSDRLPRVVREGAIPSAEVLRALALEGGREDLPPHP